MKSEYKRAAYEGATRGMKMRNVICDMCNKVLGEIEENVDMKSVTCKECKDSLSRAFRRKRQEVGLRRANQ